MRAMDQMPGFDETPTWTYPASSYPNRSKNPVAAFRTQAFLMGGSGGFLGVGN